MVAAAVSTMVPSWLEIAALLAVVFGLGAVGWIALWYEPVERDELPPPEPPEPPLRIDDVETDWSWPERPAPEQSAESVYDQQTIERR